MFDDQFGGAPSTDHGAPNVADASQVWDWKAGLLMRQVLTRRHVDVGQLLNLLEEVDHRKARSLLAETYLSLEMQKAARKSDREVTDDIHDVVGKILRYHPKLIRLSEVMMKGTLAAVGLSILSIWLWIAHDFILIHPFLSYLIISVSPFIYLMGKKADCGPINKVPREERHGRVLEFRRAA